MLPTSRFTQAEIQQQETLETLNLSSASEAYKDIVTRMIAYKTKASTHRVKVGPDQFNQLLETEVLAIIQYLKENPQDRDLIHPESLPQFDNHTRMYGGAQ